MSEATYNILKAKYHPGTADKEQASVLPTLTVEDVQKAAAKSKKAIHVVMSAAEHDADEIMKACHAFNLKLKELPRGSAASGLITQSHILLADLNGIPKGSWVYVTLNGESFE